MPVVAWNDERAARRGAAATTLCVDNRVTCVVCTSKESMYYLAGYDTPGVCPFAALVLRADARPVLITRLLESTNVADANVDVCACSLADDPHAKVRDAICGAVRVGYEAKRVSVHDHARLCALAPGVEWVDVGDELVGHRLRKTHTEIACVAAAARAVDSAVTGLHVSPGMRETEVRAMLDARLVDTEYAAYPTFVASGRNGFRGHHAATADARVVAHAPLFVEVGAAVARYHAARMHTMWIGDRPPPWFRRAMASMRRALAAGMDAARDGAIARSVDAAMRAAAQPLDDGVVMSERTAYAIGAAFPPDWTEDQLLIDATSDVVLRDGHVLHMIPWVQIVGKGAVGVSETVVVCDGGALPARTLT